MPNAERGRADGNKAGTFVLVAAIGVVAVVSILGSRTGPDRASSTEPPAPTAEPSTASRPRSSEPFFLDLRTGLRTPLPRSLADGYGYVGSPDGTALVYVTCGPTCDSRQTAIARPDGTVLRLLASAEDPIWFDARWSRDGTHLVYGEWSGEDGDPGNLFVLDLASGRRTQLTHLHRSRTPRPFLRPMFSPDGRRVISFRPRPSSGDMRFDAWSVPATGGTPRLVLRNASFPTYPPAGAIPTYDPDGRVRGLGRRGIVYVSPQGGEAAGSGIWVADGRGSRRKLVTAQSEISGPTFSPDGTRIAYQDGGSVFVLFLRSGLRSKVAAGHFVEWLGDETLIVVP